MRRRLPLLLLLALVAVPLPRQDAAASCASPYLDLSDGTVLAAGAGATVEGRAFVDGCRDTMSCSGTLGCESCEYDEPPPRPRRDLDLTLVQAGRSWLLDTADAGSEEDDRLGQVTWSFVLPPEAGPGPAVLRVDGEDLAEVRVG